MNESISISFPAQKEYALLLRMAASGAAAAWGVGVDVMEDLSAAAEEAMDFLLLGESAPGTLLYCDLSRKQDGLGLFLRLSTRQGVRDDAPSVIRAILETLAQEVVLFSDERGGTGARITLRCKV